MVNSAAVSSTAARARASAATAAPQVSTDFGRAFNLIEPVGRDDAIGYQAAHSLEAHGRVGNETHHLIQQC
ncbi:MAG: hypothetical protein GY856_40810 [bacterium]|nr:hypothetical protein [bacterium]